MLILLLTVAVWLNHFKLEHKLDKEATEREEIEQLLRAKDKQIDFYLNKANQLIFELQVAKLKDVPQKRDFEDPLVWDSLETEELRIILERYEEYYGVIDEYDIPKTETLGGLRSQSAIGDSLQNIKYRFS